jgi:hypothetical protein
MAKDGLGNPNVSLCPRGWRRDDRELLQLVTRVTGFSMQKLRDLWRALVKRLGKGYEE